MTISRVLTTVSTNWLKSQLGSTVTKTAPRHLRVLDTSFVTDREVDTYTECYQIGHIPQSLHFRIFQCTEPHPHFPVPLPDANCFTDYVQSLGVWPDTHVVAYDRFGPSSAYRAWWMFRLFGHKNVSVLDGGLRKWLADEFDITIDEPEVERSNFEARLDKNLSRQYEDVANNAESKHEQLVDARPLLSDSCIDEETGGRIVGSTHISFPDMFNEDGTMKSEDDLKAMFDSAGVDLGRPIISTCRTGMTACGLAAAAHILGKEHVPVYYGSWYEFSRRAPEELKLRPEPKNSD